MNTNHTPGPWRVGDAGHTVFGPPNGKPAPEIIASDLARANARLIAAAPDMLRALRAMRSALSIFHDATEEPNDLTMANVGDALNAADAAIAKATGAQP